MEPLITPRPIDVEPAAEISLVPLARLPFVQTTSPRAASLPAGPVSADSTPVGEEQPATAVKLKIESPSIEPPSRQRAEQGFETPQATPLVFDKIVSAASDGRPTTSKRTALPARMLKLHELLAPHSGLIMAAAITLAAVTLGWLNVQPQPAENAYRSSSERREAAWQRQSEDQSAPRSEPAPDFDSLVKMDLAKKGQVNRTPQVAALVRLGELIPGHVAPAGAPVAPANIAYPSTSMASDYLTGIKPKEQSPANSSEAAARLAQRPGEEPR